MTLLVYLLAFNYLAILVWLTIGLFRIEKNSDKENTEGISIIVAARNEAAIISNLLARLKNQSYPADKYEVIVVDDRSEDQTAEIILKHLEKFPNLKLSGISSDEKGGKKRALVKGISSAKFSILLFTDADCLPHPDWLREVNKHFTQETDVVVGYSPLIANLGKVLMRLKNLERLSIFAVSAGSIGWNYGTTCTGRNFAYRQQLYEEVNGFSGLEDIPSGDDDLMLQRMSAKARKMTFMFTPESVVPAKDDKDISGQINQETRRASKWRLYPLPIQIGSALVFLFYLAIAFSFLLFLSGRFALSNLLSVLIIKTLAELLILLTFTLKMKQSKYLIYYPLAAVIHLPYFLFFALKGTFGRYKWR